jgi:hypothetical protein
LKSKPKPKIEAPAVVQSWRKGLLCGCDHGTLADSSAINSIIQFRDDFKPDIVVHLGDSADTTAFRSGARGTADQSVDPDEDISAALVFLERLKPDVFFIGNHEHRLWKFINDPDARVASCARKLIHDLTTFVRDELKATLVDHYDITRSWMRLGPYLIGHGWMYGENALRDHVETVGGNCIIAHTHSFQVARGRVLGGATGISVGMLADGAKLTYAHGRRATAKWTTSFLSVEYTDTQLVYRPNIIRESMPAVFETVCPRAKELPPVLKPPLLSPQP